MEKVYSKTSTLNLATQRINGHFYSKIVFKFSPNFCSIDSFDSDIDIPLATDCKQMKSHKSR